MRCSNTIIPGLEESEKFLKGHRDIGMKIQQELDKSDKGYTFKVLSSYKPTNTVKAYKLFRVKNNKLYPLFVDANRSLPVGKWLEAEAGELTNKGKVKSSIGALAFRPGWHSGDLPLATHIGGKVDPDTGSRVKGSMPPNVRENNQVWAEIEVPADFDWQSVAISRAPLVKSGPNKGKPNAREAHITDQLPSKGYYKYKTNSNMTGSWLISGELKINRVLSDAEVRSINDAAGTADLVRDYELPYFKADETQAPATAGSYEDTGVYYHGSSSATNIEGDWSTSDANIYGSGFYTTTSKEVAQSYTKKGRGSEPTVYRIKEINKGPSKNLETTPAKLYGRGLLDEYVELEGKSLIEALNEFRNDSSDFSLTRTDVIEIIDAVFDRLASKGYTSVTHHGGALTGNKTKHLVKIFLRPTRDIRLIKQ